MAPAHLTGRNQAKLLTGDPDGQGHNAHAGAGPQHSRGHGKDGNQHSRAWKPGVTDRADGRQAAPIPSPTGTPQSESNQQQQRRKSGRPGVSSNPITHCAFLGTSLTTESQSFLVKQDYAPRRVTVKIKQHACGHSALPGIRETTAHSEKCT